jgi:glycosyltransferase involved in cell wall biosynthesis
MEERHLIFFAPYLPPAPFVSAQRSRHFIEALEDKGYNLSLLTGKSGDWGKSLWFDLPSSLRNGWAAFFRELLSAIEFAIRCALIKKPTVFVVSPPLLVALAAALTAKWQNRFLILDFREHPAASQLQRLRLHPRGLAARWIEELVNWLCLQAELIFTVTDGLRKQLIDEHPDMAGRIFTIHTGYDRDTVQLSAQRFPKFTCVFYGALNSLNDVAFLKSVATEASSLEFLVIGQGSHAKILEGDSLNPKLKNIRVETSLTTQQALALVSQSHLGLCFRRSGLTGEAGFPQSVFDYIGSGLPTLVCPKSDAAEFVEKSGCGVAFVKKDVRAVADKITELATRKDLYAALEEKTRTVRDGLSRQAQREIMVGILDQV